MKIRVLWIIVKHFFTPILPRRDGESKYMLMQCVLAMIGVILM